MGRSGRWRTPSTTRGDARQLDLFEDRPAVARTPLEPPSNRSDTSIDAARSIREHAPEQRHQVYQALASFGRAGATRDQLALRMGMQISSITARVNELLRLGLAVDSGRRRETRTGRRAAVLVVTDADLPHVNS